jgi:hypothetical protein
MEQNSFKSFRGMLTWCTSCEVRTKQSVFRKTISGSGHHVSTNALHVIYQHCVNCRSYIAEVALGGLVIAWLSLDLRFVGWNPAEDDGFLREIKNQARLPSEGKKRRWSHVACFHGALKNPTSMTEILRKPSFSCFATRSLYWYLPENSDGRIRNDQKSDGEAQ